MSPIRISTWSYKSSTEAVEELVSSIPASNWPRLILGWGEDVGEQAGKVRLVDTVSEAKQG